MLALINKQRGVILSKAPGALRETGKRNEFWIIKEGHSQEGKPRKNERGVQRLYALREAAGI
ncbi:MAG: hypothetical protein IKP17_09320 [Oscillospiraceae bacterium]|nr:hypothetical protein [Oscillospiraceae bacterium]